MRKKYKNSLVLGKFYGLHNGHLYLIDTAVENSETVHVMVCHNSEQKIPGDIRFNILKDIYSKNKNVIIHSCDDSGLPQYESECDTIDEFYSYWVPFVYKFVNNLEAVFTSENYGDDFAKYLGIEHYLVDKDRNKFPISGTMIRSNPFINWNFIPKEARPYFTKKVAIMGPESVGKSTLTENLSNFFKTNFVEEWGRTVYEKNGNSISIEDFIPISIGRQKLEDELIKESNKIIFCDTEDITTYLFSKMYYHNEYKEIEDWFINEIEKKEKYDIYILLKPDCIAVQDGTRMFLEERDKHYQEIKTWLSKDGYNLFEVGGDWSDRLTKSIEIVKSQFNI